MIYKLVIQFQYILCDDKKESFSIIFAENFDQINVIDLQSELKILIHVGGHENIVNILGACTKGTFV